MNYITPSGNYYEGDRADIKDVACAKRPAGRVFAGTISLDHQVMWREKTTQELSDEKDAATAAYLEGGVGKVDTAKAFALAVLDEVNVLRANAGLVQRTIAQMRAAIKAKLGL